MSVVVFVWSLARQAYALRLFAKRGSACRQLCYHISAGAVGWGITGGAACLALISMARFPPLAAASLTVLASAGGDAYTDSGRTLGRVIGIIALRSAMPGVPWSEIMRVFENSQSAPLSESQSKPQQSPQDSDISTRRNASINASSNSDNNNSSDNES